MSNSVKLEIEGVMMNVVRGYDSQVSSEMKEREILEQVDWSDRVYCQAGENGDWSRLQWACW